MLSIVVDIVLYYIVQGGDDMRAFLVMVMLTLVMCLSGCGESEKEIFEERIKEDRLNHIDHEHPMECLVDGKYFIVLPDGTSMCRDGLDTHYYSRELFSIFVISDGLVTTEQMFPQEYLWGHYAIRWLFRAVESGNYTLESFNNGWRVRYIADQPNKDNITTFEIILDSGYQPMSANFELKAGSIVNVSILRFDDSLTVDIPEVLLGHFD